MRRILLSTAKILISAALLYFSLRKVNPFELAARIRVEERFSITRAFDATTSLYDLVLAGR